MAKSKKSKIEWSHYQTDIFNFVKNGQGNAVIEASAGSGKTSSLLKCLDFIDEDKRILLTAFNKDIVNVLAKKTKKLKNVTAMTMHGLGLQMLHSNFGKSKLELDEYKYKSFITSNLKELTSINTYELSKNDFYKYLTNIEKYIDFGRYYLAQTIKDLDFIGEMYDIDAVADEKSIAIQAMDWGKRNLDSIDYTDMVWLPNVLMCNPYGLKFDWIMTDEAQDLNRAQRELMLKCRKINTRMLIFGDEKQCIYSFGGSDPDSFEALKSLPNTVSLPLSISYRCADNIVEFAHQLVPTIEKNNDGRKGVIEEVSNIDEIKDGDMVLCRTNAPLMQIYNTFIKEGKKCFVRGKDIGNNLKQLVKSTKKENLGNDLKTDGVFVRLYNRLFESRDNLMIHSNIDYETAMQSSIITNFLDMIRALEVLSEGLNNATELIDRISEVFSDRKKNGISLSTIHKAKGLEADRVFIACKSLMPSKSAKKDWELNQEYNLMYVAYTRAKNMLGFLDETDFKNFYSDSKQEKNRLKDIELKVDSILGKKPKYITSGISFSSEIIKRAKKIELPKSNTKTLNNNTKKIQTRPTLTGLFNRKITSKKIK
jgi:DNA helicase-2/ATP-dependent DNA helicase PcrA